MKKSLFLISISIFFFLFSCNTVQRKQENNDIDTSFVSNTIISKSDTIIPNTNKVKNDDIVSKNKVIHNAPNQEKIDSIKNQKLKNKKR